MIIENALASLDPASLGLDPAAASRARSARLADSAHQFEAMMLQEILKPLNFSASPGSDEDSESSGAGSTIQGYGTEALAKAVSDGGGFGIAQHIIQQVAAQDAKRQPAAGSKV